VATFEEKQDVISKLNVSIFPSEDFKTMGGKSGVNFLPGNSDNIQCGKIIFAPLKGMIPRTTHEFRQVSNLPWRLFPVTFASPPVKDKVKKLSRITCL
jgi:hypothetical protein